MCFGSRFQVACLKLEIILSFGCVCSMKMGLLKCTSPVLFDTVAHRGHATFYLSRDKLNFIAR